MYALFFGFSFLSTQNKMLFLLCYVTKKSNTSLFQSWSEYFWQLGKHGNNTFLYFLWQFEEYIGVWMYVYVCLSQNIH